MSQWGFPANRHIICLSIRLLLLLWTLPIAVTAQNSSSVNPDFVEAFNYAQSTNSITLRDWISLLTLCFAPVIAHFVAGTPKPVYLTYKPVRWHDRICIYNPTTILWRYFAITDRRLRHKSWNAADMAASNTYFWTAQGWNGSESMMRDSRAFLTKTPTHHRTAFFSSESIKTLIVSLQGVQALASLIGGFLAEQLGIGNSVFCATLAIDTIFFPFAIFGLLRLFAAFWLTEDYSYADRLDALDALTIINSHTESETEQAITHTMDRKSTSTLMTMGLLEYSPHETVFDPPNNWKAIALRVTYLLPIIGLLLICILFSTPGLSKFTIYPYLAHGISSSSSTHFQNLPNPTSYEQFQIYSVTSLTLAIVGILFLLVTLILFVFYMFVKNSTASKTTVIPCIASTAYKVYTVLLLLGAVALMVVSGVATRKSACGHYTTFPVYMDQLICKGSPVYAGASTGLFGIVAWNQYDSNGESTYASNFTSNSTQILHLNGWCSGTLALEYGLTQVELGNSLDLGL